MKPPALVPTPAARRDMLIDEIIAVRRLRKPTTPAELIAWRDEGRSG